jgi:ketosteroid isomerase-like protein
MPPKNQEEAAVALLQAFSDAWNRHDLPALMHFMHPACVFLTASGSDVCGTRHVGHAAVSKAFSAAWELFPDAQWRNGRHWVFADRGVSEWTFTGTAVDGTRSESDGVDLFTFCDGKIIEKNVFRKDRPRLAAIACGLL